LLQACLNGGRSRRDHPAIPLTPAALGRDAAAVRAAGADTLHIHPRTAGGRESLHRDAIAAALEAVREAAPGMPVGVSTGAWIDTGGPARLPALRAWRVLPDFVSVNLTEADAEQVVGLMHARGIGVETGLGSVADAERLVAGRMPRYSLRVLVEVEGAPDRARAEALRILDVLDAARMRKPVLLHGRDRCAWEMVALAAERGLASRVGFEDMLTLPSGALAAGNAALVAAAVRIRSAV